MVKFELVKSEMEFAYKNRKEIATGCTRDGINESVQVIASFDTAEMALEALKGYESSIDKLSGGNGTYYLVTEYSVEKSEYDESGNWMSGGDIYGFYNLDTSVLED